MVGLITLAMVGVMWAAYTLWRWGVVRMVRRARRRSEWSLPCTTAQLDVLRTNPTFIEVLALARLTNQLRFVQSALPPLENDSPSARRQLINAFLFTAALLHESVPLAQRLAQRYRYRLPSADALTKLLQDKEVRDLLATHIPRLSSETVLRVDERRISEHLASLADDTYIFASGATYGSGQLYYDLADITTFLPTLSHPSSYEALVNAAETIGRRTTATGLVFRRAADDLIAEVLAHEQFLAGRLPAREDAL